ncbi:MAG: mechanosensitive ion channel domain-containing protein [Crocinitomicaceae bacterium]
MREELNLIWDKLDNWYQSLIVMLPNILLALLVGISVFFISKGVKILVKRYILAKWENEELKAIFSKTIQFVVIVLGFLFALSIVNLDKTVTSILAGVGVVGIAVGFAFQDIAANFISGLFMATNKPFAIGDIIEVNGISGTVQELKLRTTTIKTFQGNDVIIPNTELFQNAVTNFTSTAERRIDLEVGVSYNDDLAHAKEVAIAAVNKVETLKKERGVEVLFTEFGGSSINFEVRFWINNGETANLLKTKSDAIMEIKTAFDNEGISIPFPITTLDLSESEHIFKNISA